MNQRKVRRSRLAPPDDPIFTRGFVVGATVFPAKVPGAAVPMEEDLAPPGPDWELVTDEEELARLEQEVGTIARTQPFWRKKA